uniref:Uncharacterized protein n=1 Tax=Moniliophthora roreri TaxID=221103 RepID=A0A0W0GC69_MONRR
MPSHTAASALIKLYFLGLPWDLPTWQDITNVRHGLFPEDDARLPKGWIRSHALDIKSYFERYNAQPSEDAKVRFATQTAGSEAVPGRKKWADWVQDNYASWGIHDTIVKCFHKHLCHPTTILINSGLDKPWPNSLHHIPKALYSIALELFGPEIFPDDNPTLPDHLHSPLTPFAQRAWNLLRTQTNKGLKNMNKTEEAANKAFNELNLAKPTKAKVIATIRAVGKWKNVVDVYSSKENREKAKQMLEELDAIMATLENAKAAGGTRRITASQMNLIAQLASEEDIRDLFHVYADYFESQPDDDGPVLSSDLNAARLDALEGGDLGMENVAAMGPAELSSALGFLKDNLPSQFNPLRHKLGFNSWDNPQDFQSDDSSIPPACTLSQLHWHQLAGVYSFISNTFTESACPDACNGMLIADEVGLGKTALCISIIAFLNQAVMMDRTDLPRPPILEKYRYLKGSENLPALPHLIITPGTIRTQWVKELKTLFRRYSVDFLLYDCPKAGNKDFWGPSGPLQKSKQDKQNIIILMTHSSLQNEFQRVFSMVLPKPAVRRPWELPEQLQTLQGSLFEQSFLTIILDEAHEFRNLGAKHFAAMRIFQQAHIRLVVTATPLLTSHKDLAAMARLVAAPHFFMEESFLEAKEDEAELRRAKKLDDNGLSVTQFQVTIVRRIQKAMIPHILRRTTDSRDYLGQPLLDLPPYQDIIGVLTLTPREMNIINDLAEKAKLDVNAANESGKFVTRNFYLNFRMGVVFAKENPDDPNPKFQTLEEWYKVKSTKMDTTARVCQHYLTRDDMPDVEFVDGEAVFPSAPLTELEDVISQSRRILIYSEFSGMHSVLKNVRAPLFCYPRLIKRFLKVLSLYGVQSLSLDGKLALAKRDAIVAQFHQPNNPRVLIFSSVGTTGLNLCIADVVIFFDQPWSAQDVRQIRGRAHRQPQQKTVKVIHLLADETADLLMNGMAEQKKVMFDAFMQKKLGKELVDLLSGKTVHNPEPQLDHPDDVEPKKRRRQAKKADEERPNDGPSQDDKKQKGKGRSKTKAKAQTTSVGAPQCSTETSKGLAPAGSNVEMDLVPEQEAKSETKAEAKTTSVDAPQCGASTADEGLAAAGSDVEMDLVLEQGCRSSHSNPQTSMQSVHTNLCPRDQSFADFSDGGNLSSPHPHSEGESLGDFSDGQELAMATSGDEELLQSMETMKTTGRARSHELSEYKSSRPLKRHTVGSPPHPEAESRPRHTPTSSQGSIRSRSKRRRRAPSEDSDDPQCHSEQHQAEQGPNAFLQKLDKAANESDDDIPIDPTRPATPPPEATKSQSNPFLVMKPAEQDQRDARPSAPKKNAFLPANTEVPPRKHGHKPWSARSSKPLSAVKGPLEARRASNQGSSKRGGEEPTNNLESEPRTVPNILPLHRRPGNLSDDDDDEPAVTQNMLRGYKRR